MDIISWIREEQEQLDFLLFQEGRNKMHFVKIGSKRAVNLDNVTQIIYQPLGSQSNSMPCFLIEFFGSDDYVTIYNASDPDTFRQLQTWMDEQPALLGEE